MKKREKKALELVEKGTQIQFEGIPKSEPRARHKNIGKIQSTYWVCKKRHAFEVKQRVHPDREQELRCPECGARAENAVNKSTYMYYLNKHGRGDKKAYIKRFGEKGNAEND